MKFEEVEVGQTYVLDDGVEFYDSRKGASAHIRAGLRVKVKRKVKYAYSSGCFVESRYMSFEVRPSDLSEIPE